jgi:N-acyl-D-amino-acid deacylase
MNSLRRNMRIGRSLTLLIVVLVLSVGVSAQNTAPEIYDIVIRNSRVLDGAGNPAILADVAIRDGHFARIGVVTGRGRKEIDAVGRYVSPGWIDMMDQSGAALLENGLAENKLQEGVTTAIAGEGGTPVPVEKIPEYFSTLQRQGISINFGTYFSETQARVAILGHESRAPNADELERMKAIMEQAMKAGAMGMTTALIYPPSSFAATPELIEVAKSAAKYGGIYASHVRGEGKEVVSAVDELIEISEKAGLPAEIFHLKAAYGPGWGTLMKAIGQHVDAARSRGLDVAADLYVYAAGGTGLEATIPSWAHEGGQDALIKRLADPQIRERLKHEIREGSPGWWNIVEAAGGWDGIVLVNANNPANARYEGKKMSEVAREMGKDPADAAFDLVSQGKGRVMALYYMMSENDIENALRFPWTSIGSDAGTALGPGKPDAIGLPHPRAYGNFPRVLGQYVRERHVLTLPEAIRKMTSWPATRMRLADRGVVREGMWADIVIFDADRIHDCATYEKPNLYPEGIDWVLVNGEVVIDHGHHTGARPGKILYGPGRRIAQVQAEATAPIVTLPIDVRVPKPPAPFHADRKIHLVYEINLSNLGVNECVLDRLVVMPANPADKPLAAYEAQELVDALARPGMPDLRGASKLAIGPGQRAVLYVWVSVPEDVQIPTVLSHKLTVRVGEARREFSIDAARTAVEPAPKVIASPLRGDAWLAGNGPSNTSGHRRGVIPIDGEARIPQRFAIDWVQLRPDGTTHEGDPKDNRNYRAYGQPVYAVANGTISAVKDGIPENVPGATSRAVPITLDTVAGNHVIINLGDGVYAFYAHLQPGSIKVKLGDKVRAGQVLAALGNSGNSTEPHLHFHLINANSPLGGEGLPYAYQAFELEGRTSGLRAERMDWIRLPSPELHRLEMPLENEVVRFAAGGVTGNN